MKKGKTILSITLLFMSVFANNIDRVFRSDAGINPFPLRPDIRTSVGWYWDYLGDIVSFTFLMGTVVVILEVVYAHFADFRKKGYYALYTFTWMWHRVFWVILLTSVLDLIHYLLAARQIEWFFLGINGVFLVLTAIFIYKAFKR